LGVLAVSAGSQVERVGYSDALQVLSLQVRSLVAVDQDVMYEEGKQPEVVDFIRQVWQVLLGWQTTSI